MTCGHRLPKSGQSRCCSAGIPDGLEIEHDPIPVSARPTGIKRPGVPQLAAGFPDRAVAPAELGLRDERVQSEGQTKAKGGKLCCRSSVAPPQVRRGEEIPAAVMAGSHVWVDGNSLSLSLSLC